MADGMFARRPIPANSVIAYYAGLKVVNPTLTMSNMTAVDRESWHTNLIRGRMGHINVPPEMTDISVFRATLGAVYTQRHKVDNVSKKYFLVQKNLPNI